MFVVVIFYSTTQLIGQISNDQVKTIQTEFEKEKREIVIEYLGISIDSNKDFWDLYDVYEEERMKIGLERFTNMSEYIYREEELSDEELDKTLQEFILIKQKSDDLLLDYYSKIKVKSGVRIATKFYMMERYFQNVVRINYMREIPFVNGLEHR